MKLLICKGSLALSAVMFLEIGTAITVSATSVSSISNLKTVVVSHCKIGTSYSNNEDSEPPNRGQKSNQGGGSQGGSRAYGANIFLNQPLRDTSFYGRRMFI